MSDQSFHLAEADRRISNMARVGTVSSVNLTAVPPTARVQFTDDWESDDLPWAPGAAGRRRTWDPPKRGDQVLVTSLSGDTGNGIITHRLNSDAVPAPSSSADLDIIGQWDDGGSDIYDSATSTRTITAPAGGSIVFVVGASTITITDQAITFSSPAVNLGASAGEGVARLGDHVKIDTGTSAGLWPIVEASKVVKSA